MVSFVRFCVFCCMLSLIMIACNKPAPQLPANKVVHVDSMALALTKINNQVIEYEDSVINAYVADSFPEMKKSGQGFWYWNMSNTKGHLLKENDACRVSVTIYDLDGVLCDKQDMKIKIGKNQIFKGLDDGLRLLVRGDNAWFVFPWYLAYGLKGNGDKVPPYTSLKVYVKVYRDF